MRRFAGRLLATPLLGVWLLGCCANMPLRADEPAAAQAEAQTRRVITARVVAASAGKYWIGVQAEATDETLRAQLKLDAGLVVNDVIPESPAAKAGIERHDVLLRFGETSVASVEDLINAVEKNKDQEVDVRLLRRGEERTVKVTPQERPAGAAELRLPLRIDEETVEKMLADKDGNVLRLRTVGPGFVTEKLLHDAGEQAFPEDVTVNITKEGKAPAKISVKRKDQSWETTEDKLQELPEDVRGAVERFLHRGPHSVLLGGAPGIRGFTFSVPSGQESELRKKSLKMLEEALQGVPEGARVEIEKAIRRAPPPTVASPAGDQTKVLEELRRAVDHLAKQVETLQKFMESNKK